jgi:hypothetical protein
LVFGRGYVQRMNKWARVQALGQGQGQGQGGRPSSSGTASGGSPPTCPLPKASLPWAETSCASRCPTSLSTSLRACRPSTTTWRSSATS